MHAGDVVEVDFGMPAGSEPGFIRPAVVVTADLILAARPRTFHVVPITSNVERSLPTEVPVSASGLVRPSVAQCHLCTVISGQRSASADFGSIGAASLVQIHSVLGDILDIL
ncbi:type II toxin-antitoxin system PemK/MazF family toxin [soil metagenome]